MIVLTLNERKIFLNISIVPFLVPAFDLLVITLQVFLSFPFSKTSLLFVLEFSLGYFSGFHNNNK